MNSIEEPCKDKVPLCLENFLKNFVKRALLFQKKEL